MNSYRNNAIIAGVLFIIADVVGFLSLPFMGPVNATDYLVSVSANAGLVATGALLIFIGGAAAIGIAISLYPVLRKYNEGLALGAVGFRTAEGVFDIVGFIGLLLLITLSQQFVKAGAPDSSYFQTLGVLAVSGYHLVENVGKLLAFSIGCSAILYHILSNKTSSSMVIGLGSCCRHIHHGIMLVNHVRSHRSLFYGTNRFESSNTPARIGSCGMADSQRIQSIRNCFQVSSCG